MSTDERAALAALSAALGKDPEQVQAAGGNTSVKEGGVLWVKASGLWLKDAKRLNVFVPVRHADVLQGIAAGLEDPVTPAIARDLDQEGLRPSIETTLHALLPHRVVVHTHSVRTIALAVRTDAEALIAARLDGLRHAFVPYAKPGLPLTRIVAKRLTAQPIDVLVLGNHGLVVGGASVDDADALLRDVERRLDAPDAQLRTVEPNSLRDDAAAVGLRPVKHGRAHGLAFDPARLAYACDGSLYPDHVIFLGRAASLLSTLKEADVRTARELGSKLLIVPERGLFVPGDASESADELALCLALVLSRVPPGASLIRLDRAAEDALLDWDAEKYRQSLASAPQGR
jgi:rhamnose utilization protein RhaD (predicted bifunctional aldolase and dehydrogenase)